MTRRETALVSLTISVIVLWMGIAFFWNRPHPDSGTNRFGPTAEASGYREMERLLRSSQNILARDRHTAARLADLETRRLPAANLSQAQLKFLQAVESLASRNHLPVAQKNTVRYADGAIGVTLAGKASAAALVAFLQQTATAPMGIVVQRLQLHALPEERRLEYNLAVSTLWVARHGK
jgi:hypothetical protein